MPRTLRVRGIGPWGFRGIRVRSARPDAQPVAVGAYDGARYAAPRRVAGAPGERVDRVASGSGPREHPILVRRVGQCLIQLVLVPTDQCGPSDVVIRDLYVFLLR